MVSAPTASTTSLSQRISDEFSLSQQIQETFDTANIISKRLNEMATNYQRLASSFRMPDLETQQMMLDSMNEFAEMMPRRSRAFQNTMKDVEPLFSKTVQKSSSPASVSMATEAGVSNTLLRQSASHEIGEFPSTTESATTTPEVAIEDFSSNPETVASLSFSWIVNSQKEICALMVLSLSGGILVIYGPEGINWYGALANKIVDTMITILLTAFLLDRK